MAISNVAECYHGGAFFSAIGDEFDHLNRAAHVISADVLDAWFPPSPRVTMALASHLPWLLRTSPPAGAEGLVRTIARTRDVEEHNVLAGGGSSDLIFLALTRWLSADSRVLILDPMYGEYAYVLERLIGCHVDRFVLTRDDDYNLDVGALTNQLRREAYDLVILVNPNSPTGRYTPADGMRELLDAVPLSTRVWIDETYIEYVGRHQSLGREAASRLNVIVCKSMSKVYALSGARVGYLVGSPSLLAELRPHNPPWAVSLLGQLAGVHALQDEAYYEHQWATTHVLRESLSASLGELGLDVVRGVANFVLFHLPTRAPDAQFVLARARARGLFLRDASSMGAQLGERAIRMAVKDSSTNARMMDIMREVLE
jgi:histidinol-phosphate/aromatic aminotransferase/cobyric acid decarboxylase-like protein